MSAAATEFTCNIDAAVTLTTPDDFGALAAELVVERVVLIPIV
jgi:hypothetical protein